MTNRLNPTTTIFSAQSFIYTYLLTNKPPTKDGVYPSYRGFFRGQEITLKRKSMKSNEWTATFVNSSTSIKITDYGDNFVMRRLLDEMDNLN